MNFLAHLWLADTTKTSYAGAILGDIVHGRLEGTALPQELVLGIRIHRRVDVVTDHHPLSQDWREQFPTGARRYAGIVLDLLCDHALALDWSRYSESPLAPFCDRAAAAVAADKAAFLRYGSWAPDAQRFAALLCSYARWQGYEYALQRTANRLRKPQALLDAGQRAPTLLPAVRNGLPALLEDLQDAAEQLRDA